MAPRRENNRVSGVQGTPSFRSRSLLTTVKSVFWCVNVLFEHLVRDFWTLKFLFTTRNLIPPLYKTFKAPTRVSKITVIIIIYYCIYPNYHAFILIKYIHYNKTTIMRLNKHTQLLIPLWSSKWKNKKVVLCMFFYNNFNYNLQKFCFINANTYTWNQRRKCALLLKKNIVKNL